MCAVKGSIRENVSERVRDAEERRSDEYEVCCAVRGGGRAAGVRECVVCAGWTELEQYGECVFA